MLVRHHDAQCAPPLRLPPGRCNCRRGTTSGRRLVTECDTAHETSNDDCSIIGVFRDRSRQGIAASFSLLADLRNKQLTVVGDPPPTSSRLQVDKNAPVQCNGAPYCIFSGSDAEIIIRQLQTGSLIFIDVFTAKGPLKFSLSTKGYRAGIAKIQAQGYAVPKN